MKQKFVDLSDSDSYFEGLTIRTEPRIHRCEPSWSWEVERLHDHDLWCVLNGRGEMRRNGQTCRISPGASWLLEPGDRMRATHDPENRLRVMAVHIDLLAAGSPRGLYDHERPQAGVRVQNLGLLEALSRGCVSSYRQGGPLGQAQALLYLRQLLMLLLQASQDSQAEVFDSRIAQVYDAILEEPGRDWSVPQLARTANLSRSQFSRLFKEATGRSPMRCVLEARIERACQLLRETSLQIGQIAEALGYRDIFYFSRQFKDITGETPSRFRAATSEG